MQVSTDTTAILPAEQPQTTLAAKLPPGALAASSPSTTRPQSTNNAQSSEIPGVTPEPLLTIRWDASGRLYYVISDAKSGTEIAQVPPEELRIVGEGIAIFMKQLEAHRSAIPCIETDA